MKLYRQSVRENVLRLCVDLLVVCLCWLFSYVMRFEWEVVDLTKGHDHVGRYAALLPLLVLSYFTAFTTQKIYATRLERRRIWEENLALASAHVFGFLYFIAATYFLFDHRFSRVVLVFFFVLTPVLLPFGRSFVRKLLRFLDRKRPTTRATAVIIGEGPVSDKLAEITHTRKDWKLKVLGRYVPEEASQLRHSMIAGTVDIAFVSTHARNAEWANEIFDAIGNSVTEIIYVPDFGAPTFLSPQILKIQDFGAVVLNSSPLEGYGAVVKRFYDIIFSLLFIICFSPVFLLCAALVGLTSRGPILYRQERMGLDGATFQCLKFRGMVHNAEQGSGPVWAQPDDQRTTWIGKWLRRTSLDEIPQFFNVLKGDMSVVGPRPERPVFVQEFREKIPGYMLRHSAKAGITGWAQINGWRGNTSLEKRIECDLWYLQNWSLLLDLKICLLTPFKGFIHPNAY